MQCEAKNCKCADLASINFDFQIQNYHDNQKRNKLYICNSLFSTNESSNNESRSSNYKKSLK